MQLFYKGFFTKTFNYINLNIILNILTKKKYI